MNTLHLLDSAGRLEPSLANELRVVAQAALDRHAQLLELDGLDVALHLSPWTIPETGVVGTAPDGYTVLVGLTPRNPNFAACWRVELAATLAHELHHARRWRGPGYGWELLSALVSEGLAQHHERLERGAMPLYARPTTDLDALWARARSALDGPYDHHGWFMGSPAADLPRWGGYALGYELVRRFLAREGGDAASHADTPAEAFRGAWTSTLPS